MSNLEGAMLSDYLLLECISQGSVADVYRARQNDGQYEVAVKIFRSGYAEREAFRAYFLHEAEKIGQFDHPHILPFIEYGEGEGLLYSVTPFVKSGTLDDLLKKVGGKFSAMQALPIVQQLCDAVQYAHDHNVIHGNIKPRNVFVANDGRMLLADFGIARGYAEGHQVLNKMEWGSIQYAAPEQSLGLLRRASDIYSLGAVFFRLLTGSPVFVGTTPVDVLLKHVRQAPPLARSLEPGISDPVDDVLQKALSKRSDDRMTAIDLSRMFAAAVAFAPVASPVARSIDLTTRPLSLHSQTPVSASAGSIMTQPTLPIVQAVSLQDGQNAPRSSASELPQADLPQPSTLPEQHGFSYAEAPQASFRASEQAVPGASPYWSREPVEWSPLIQGSNGAGLIPTHASDYLRHQPALAVAGKGEETPPPARGRWLPILVVVLLVLGLLAALLSSWILPPSTSRGTGMHASSVVASGQADIFDRQMGR